jgi:hypothetical protein
VPTKSNRRNTPPCNIGDLADYLQATAKAMKEKDLQQLVVACVESLNTAGDRWYWHHHEHDSRRSTPGMLDMLIIGEPGLPMQGRRLWVELKSHRGRLRPAQTEQIERLQAGDEDVYVWRPMDWLDGTIERTLRNG